jgi:tetratricopeptide (TPR) repeat protein
MTEELINALGQLEGLRVPGRGSSFAYQGKNVPYRQIGTDLGVATVLEGSVRKSRRGLRVSARLVNVADGYQIWSEQYDRTLQDLVAVQEDIAGAVAGALRVKLASGGPASPARRYTDNFEAYDLYLRGRFLFRDQRNGAAIEQAIEYFNRAIALDSSYALAYSGLAQAYVVGETMRFSQEEVSVKAKAAALRAVALDSQLAEAHASLGRVRQFEWDWQGAERAYRRAIQLDPRNAQAHGWYGYFLAVVMSVKGRADEGVRETSLAVDLDPLNASLNVLHGIALRYARRYDEAIAYHRRAAELSTQFAGTHYNRAWAYLYKRMYLEALAELDTAARQNPSQFGDAAIPSSWRGAPPSPVVVAVIYARQGRRAEAMAILRDVEKHTRRPPWIARAYIYAALGDRERTLEALDHMIEQRAMGYGANLGSEQWDLVRSDPRFEQLLAKAGLE